MRKVQIHALCLLVSIFLTGASKAQPVDASYLNGLRPPEEVLLEIKGSDFYDVHAKRSVALFALKRVVEVHGFTRSLTKVEEEFKERISEANKQLATEWKKMGNSQVDPAYEEQKRRFGRYASDNKFTEYVLRTFLSKPAREDFETTARKHYGTSDRQTWLAGSEQERQQKAVVTARERKQKAMTGRIVMNLIPSVIGLGIVLFGFKLFTSGKRMVKEADQTAFEKTNRYGAVEVENYSEAVALRKKGYWAMQRIKWGVVVMVAGGLIALIGLSGLKDVFD